ncbi:Taurine--pyruvate aminotransferase [Paraburkholderia piptadeniae]|uniref:Diaminobutyrate--2-oxoglutarate transaminase n=1 Tax=Paraburkholderia piptadeniae TaxID=1701573 RepID=A0A1N7RVE5_9BURK|nr:aminotransferase class III-fold pyridoxal phosphate-dependent enzyme [Paraburkholderia piptadeniae]SIT39066.1 Taurine--pyruvate aminotransferase [Paraburkholderia piptadeniae]
MNSAEIADRIEDAVASDRRHVWHHLTQHKALETADPLMIVNGQGCRVWDAKGNEYIDALSGGVWTVNIGYGRTEVADAVRDQLVRMNYFAHSAANVPAAQFAESLIGKMPGMSRVYFSNSGSEANEKAFKIVRQISQTRHGGKKSKILYRERDYHGTTIAALSATGQAERRDYYGPFVPGFIEVPHCCEYRRQPESGTQDYGVWAADQIEAVILREGPGEVGALCLEPITAGGGIIEPPAGYWARVQEICRKYGVLLIIDEVVCGIGRTGKWFGYQHYGIEPDIVTMAKGLASGYAAISCTVTTEAVFNAFKEDNSRLGYFRDISTFGGCTAGPAAALVNMDIVEREGLLENCVAMGDYLKNSLLELQMRHEIIGDVRGKGLFVGFELVKDRQTKEPVAESVAVAIVANCSRKGVIVGRTNRSFSDLNNNICLAPALVVTKSEIDAIVAALDAALTEVGKG